MTEIAKGIFKNTDDNGKYYVILSKEFFEREPIQKALYEYTDVYFVNMQPSEEGFISITFTPKNDGFVDEALIKNFSNRVIDYQIRKDIDEESSHLKDIITEYAYSTVKKKLILEANLTKNYSFFPFIFKEFDEHSILLVNYAGEHFFIDKKDFSHLLERTLDKSSNIYKTLKSKFFIYSNLEELNSAVELLANQIRTKQQYLLEFTSLHMVEVTPLCNLKCHYCQASTVAIDDTEIKLQNSFKKEVIDKIIETIFQSASHSIKVELQGGEPLVNWEFSKYLIENSFKKSFEYPSKKVEIILCTNLVLIDEEKLNFLKKYNVLVSTSLDGTKEFHDAHRVTHGGKGTYDTFIDKLELTRTILGHESVGALLTVTKTNLYHIPKIVDEYIRLNFNGIFIRALNPYGRATVNETDLGYTTEEFVDEYKKTLAYIIDLNLKGHLFVDYYSSLLIRRILTPFSTGFMDLQTPAGAGISGAIYDFDGNVYPTDEARMIARMGNDIFKIGNVMKDSYSDIFANPKLVNITRSSITQATTGCSNCIYNVYCGSDPIRNYVESGDIVGYRPSSEFCKKNTLIFEHLMSIIKTNNPDIMNVFWSWINRKSIGETRV